MGKALLTDFPFCIGCLAKSNGRLGTIDGLQHDMSGTVYGRDTGLCQSRRTPGQEDIQLVSKGPYLHLRLTHSMHVTLIDGVGEL